MASTYSTNLKIELQATGENSGTWGTITNTNLGTALEQAIVGYGNPNYASDANLTLTYTDTNAAQAARALVLNVTSGVSLTATRELVVPTIQKQYIVQNNTTGAQSITVKTSAGTGITVPNGRKAHLYVNGTDVIYMDDYVDINGGAIDGTPIGANSASTGAFTTLSASGNITVSGGTANGVLYLNASKVATSGSALTFDGANLGLGVTPSAWGSGLKALQMGPQSSFSSGDTAFTPATRVGTNLYAEAGGVFKYIGTGAATTYTQQSGVHYWETAASGTAGNTITFSTAMTLDADGELGIGVTSPTSRLDVAGPASAGLTNIVKLRTGSGNSTGLEIKGNYSTEDWLINNFYSGYIAFGTNNTERARITSAGNFGIGTTSPDSKLDVRNTGGTYDKGITLQTVSAGNIGTFWTSTTDLNIGIAGAHKFTNYDGSATRMTLDSSGNLGLGVTPSASWRTDTTLAVLEVKSAGSAIWNAGARNFNFSNNSYWVTGGSFQYASTGAAAWYQQTGGEHRFYNAPSGTAGNAITFTQAMTLDASGNLGLGVTPTVNLDVRNGAGNCIISAQYGTGTKGQLIAASNEVQLKAFNGTNDVLTFVTGASERARITSDGNLLVGTTTNVSGLTGVISDVSGNVRAIPQSGSDKTTSYTLVKSDVGKFIGVGASGSITVPDATFATGDVVSIFNNTTGNVTLTMTITTAYIGGTNTDKATITLATRGVATILFISGTVCVVNGNVS